MKAAEHRQPPVELESGDDDRDRNYELYTAAEELITANWQIMILLIVW